MKNITKRIGDMNFVIEVKALRNRCTYYLYSICLGPEKEDCSRALLLLTMKDLSSIYS